MGIEKLIHNNPYYNGIYIGVVEDNNDPLKQGRVRVRVLGFHTEVKLKSDTDGLTTDQLPWATPANPIQGGSMSGIGWSGVPVNGSHVALFFIGGDHNFPIYFASIGGIYKTKPDTSKGFCDPNGKYPLNINEPDFNSLASPTNIVFEAPDNGPRIEYDSTNGSEAIKITLKKTGDTITILQNNTINIVSSSVINISGDRINVGGLTEVNLGNSNGTEAVVLEKVINKLNNHTHGYLNVATPSITDSMTTSGTTLINGTDSTTITKAK